MTEPPIQNGSGEAPNPLLQPWDTPFGLPPFATLLPDHFAPAFEEALASHSTEIEAIAADPEPPSFANTIAAIERGGRLLRRVSSTFFNLAGADTNAALQAVERMIAPRLSKHRSGIFMNPALFARVQALFEQRTELGLDAEEQRVLERYHTLFVRAGARLDSERKTRLAGILERLAVLGTQFAQNVLADENAYTLVLEGEEDLAGLPDFLRAAAARAAEDRGLPGRHVITLSRSSIEPFLQFSDRRDLREAAFRAWLGRGESGGETDNRAIISEIIQLRAERAQLLGYATFAHYKLDDTMARTPEAALALLGEVWTPAPRARPAGTGRLASPGSR